MLRAIPFIFAYLRSTALLRWYGLIFSGLRLGKGVRIGSGARISVLKGAKLVIGDRVIIDRFATIVSQRELSIGSDSYIGQGCVMVACEKISIGRDALIASYVTVRDQDHGTLPGTPFRYQPLTSDSIDIAENVWIGANATILKGVAIGANSIVGANAVVRADVPASSLAVGVPAVARSRLPIEQRRPDGDIRRSNSGDL